MKALSDAAPHLSFELCHLPHNPALTELLAGEVDLALSFSEPGDGKHPDMEETDLFSDEFVVISNPKRTRLTLESYLSAGHLVVTPWNEKQGLLDSHLERLGLKRRTVIKTPSMLSSPFIVAESDLLMAIPSFVAGKLAPTVNVSTFPLPFKAPRFTVKIYTHKRSGKREATDWLKSVMVEQMKSLDDVARPTDSSLTTAIYG